MKQQAGFILVTILMLTMLMSTMICYTMYAVMLQKRINHQNDQALQARQIAQMALLYAYQHIKQAIQQCQSARIPIHQLGAMSDNYWISSHICQGQIGSQSSQYYVSKMQTNPCATIHHHATVDYWLITARKKNYQSTVILQATVVVPSELTEICHKKLKTLTHDWQSFRIIR